MAETPSCRSRKKSARKVILVVEDDSALSQFYQYALEEDYDVFIASSGEEAVDRLKVSGNVDLVVLDLRLPGISGMDVLEEMNRFFPSIPVIIVTACTGGAIEAEVSSLGLCEYMEKPFGISDLLGKIKSCIEKTC